MQVCVFIPVVLVYKLVYKFYLYAQLLWFISTFWTKINNYNSCTCVLLYFVLRVLVWFGHRRLHLITNNIRKRYNSTNKTLLLLSLRSTLILFCFSFHSVLLSLFSHSHSFISTFVSSFLPLLAVYFMLCIIQLIQAL